MGINNNESKREVIYTNIPSTFFSSNLKFPFFARLAKKKYTAMW